MSGNSLVDRLVRHVGAISKWLLLALVLLRFGIAVARYLFDTGSVKAQEALLYVFGTMFMLVITDALRFPPRRRSRRSTPSGSLLWRAGWFRRWS